MTRKSAEKNRTARQARETKSAYHTSKTTTNGKRAAAVKNLPRVKYPPAQDLGKYIVADPRICHGKPTYRGTRIMVWQVMEMLSEGMAWDAISAQWGGSVSQDAIAETVRLAAQTFLKHASEYTVAPIEA